MKKTISHSLLNGELTKIIQERVRMPTEISDPSIISPLPFPPEYLIFFFPKDTTLNSQLSLWSSGNPSGNATVKSLFVLQARGRDCLNYRKVTSTNHFTLRGHKRSFSIVFFHNMPSQPSLRCQFGLEDHFRQLEKNQNIPGIDTELNFHR